MGGFLSAGVTPVTAKRKAILMMRVDCVKIKIQAPVSPENEEIETGHPPITIPF
jgi:hypothetical protein